MIYSNFVYSGILDRVYEKKGWICKNENILIKCFYDTENGDYNIDSAITLRPQVIQFIDGRVDVAFQACTDGSLDDNWMRLIADFEYVIP